MTLSEDVKCLKTINNIIELIKKLESDLNADEQIQMDSGLDGIISTRDLFASRNKLCIKHELSRPCNMCSLDDKSGVIQ